MRDMNQECMEYFKLLNNENKLIVLAAIREIESGCQSAPCSSHSDENKNEKILRPVRSPPGGRAFFVEGLTVFPRGKARRSSKSRAETIL